MKSRLTLKNRRLTLFILFLIFSGVSASARGGSRLPGISSLGTGQSFAIADFDGDRRPDFAIVQDGTGGAFPDYWIRLELSASAQQSFRFDAPAGGLRIEARDVNGDHALDLVLRTAWVNKPVAVLINDGHGTFSKAAPEAFPELSNSQQARWSSTFFQEWEIAGYSRPSRDGLCVGTPGACNPRVKEGRISGGQTAGCKNSLWVSHFGRAPPL